MSAFLRSDALTAEYQKILSNPQDNIHTINRIRQSIMGIADAKMVTIIMRRGDKEISLKYPADKLLDDCGHKYNTWWADASGRRELERIFGRSNDEFTPHEVIRITYGRNTIYTSEVKNNG